MVSDWSGPLKLPLGVLTLAVLMAVCTLARFNPSAASWRALTCTCTAGRWPPLKLTSPTPDTCESFCASRVSAMSCNWVNGRVAEVSPRVMTGASAGLTLAYTGGDGRSVGRKFEPALIAACTSCSATSSGRLRSKRRLMTDAPPELVDHICASPGIWPNWRSSGAVIDDVITSGLAPG